MKKTEFVTRLPNLARATVLVLALGGIYGAFDALFSLDVMKSARFATPILNFPYRLLIAGSWYAQFFLLAWVLFGTAAALLGVIFKRFKDVPALSWALSISIIFGIALPLWVKLNGWLPGFRTGKSLAGNALFALVCFFIALLLGRFFASRKFGEKNAKSRFLFTIIVLEAHFIGFSLAAHNFPKIPEVPPQQSEARLPNIILITVDTLRADHLPCYGYEKIDAPSMDRIAKEGVVYENAYASTSWTLPSLATILTGQEPEVHNMTSHESKLDGAFVTLAERLKERGYNTYAVVTNEFVNHPYGLDQGFDFYLHSNDAESYPVFGGLFLFDFIFPEKNERHSAKSMTDRAIKVLEKSSAPFFLWIHYIDPHTPYGAWYIHRLPDYAIKYKGSLSKEFDGIDDLDSGKLQPTQQDKEYIQALYDAEIMYVDENLGRLFAAMDRLNLTQNSMTILTSDHGEEFWEHGGIFHGRALYDESVRVPLIIRHPGALKPGGRIETNVGLIDLSQALFTVDDQNSFVAPGADAGSIRLSLDKQNPDGRLFQSLGRIEPQWTFLMRTSPVKTKELFDTVKDRKQQNDLFGENQDEAARIENALIEQTKTLEEKRADMKLENPDGKVEITPEMKAKLRELGYIN